MVQKNRFDCSLCGSQCESVDGVIHVKSEWNAATAACMEKVREIRFDYGDEDSDGGCAYDRCCLKILDKLKSLKRKS